MWVLCAWPEARLTDRQIVPCQVRLICRRTSGTHALAQITFILNRTPFNESGTQTVKINSAKDKLSINFSGPLPLQSTVEVVTEKASFLLSHKGNVFSHSPFLFYKRLSKMKGVRLCFFFLA